MYGPVFERIGLSKNEAKIYEVLLRHGESPAGAIAARSKVFRRNVYDSLNRLSEKGLVFEIFQSNETRYQAVDPRKLMDLLDEEDRILKEALPEFHRLSHSAQDPDGVFMYRGREGSKRHLRDIIRVGADIFYAGGEGAWFLDTGNPAVREFAKELKRKGQQISLLLHESLRENHEALPEYFRTRCRFLPESFSMPASTTLFGDHMVFYTSDFSFTVLVDARLAKSMRTWLQLMWDSFPAVQKKKRRL